MCLCARARRRATDAALMSGALAKNPQPLLAWPPSYTAPFALAAPYAARARTTPAIDAWVRAVLFVLSLAVRCFRLGLPTAIVFDEAHFGAFVDHILRRTAYFDIHPPLGKLTLAAVGWFLGYRAHDSFAYDAIGREYHAVLFLALRIVSVMFGAFTNVLMYDTARQLAVSRLCGVFCALLFMFDSLNVVESRLILMEAQLMFYSVLSLYCALKLWKTDRAKSGRSFFWLTCTALVCSCAVSVKWTAMVTPALIAVESFFALHFVGTPFSAVQCVWMLLVAVSWYLLWFHVHFERMVHTGPGTPFLMPEFRRTLVGDPSYEASAKRPSFWTMVYQLNRMMFRANAGVVERHSWETYWYQWIVNWRGLLMFTKQSDASHWQIVYLLSNPIVCICCALSVLVFATVRVLCIRYPALWPGNDLLSYAKKRRFFGTGTFLLFGWLLNLLPYVLVERSAFVYHYLPGLIYAQLLSALVVDQLRVPVRIVVVLSLCLAVIVTYIHFAPWVYCLPLDAEQHAKRRWWGRWD